MLRTEQWAHQMGQQQRRALLTKVQACKAYIAPPSTPIIVKKNPVSSYVPLISLPVVTHQTLQGTVIGLVCPSNESLANHTYHSASSGPNPTPRSQGGFGLWE